ncbi:hypothetical protein BC834DRAFT_584003 [Gloeopeniophorella convolvens]|nr:hypothetical protein BC834DRAFT_584003 [Gloeopeniophorella convolvens]
MNEATANLERAPIGLAGFTADQKMRTPDQAASADQSFPVTVPPPGPLPGTATPSGFSVNPNAAFALNYHGAGGVSVSAPYYTPSNPYMMQYNQPYPPGFGATATPGPVMYNNPAFAAPSLGTPGLYSNSHFLPTHFPQWQQGNVPQNFPSYPLGVGPGGPIPGHAEGNALPAPNSELIRQLIEQNKALQWQLQQRDEQP